MDTRWSEVGQAVKARRSGLDLTVKQATAMAQVSDTTWGSVEGGRPVSDRTRRRVAAALDWPPDAIDRLLDGEDPSTFDRPHPPTDPGGAVIMADELIGLAAIAGKLDPADRQRWVEYGQELAGEEER